MTGQARQKKKTAGAVKAAVLLFVAAGATLGTVVYVKQERGPLMSDVAAGEGGGVVAATRPVQPAPNPQAPELPIGQEQLQTSIGNAEQVLDLTVEQDASIEADVPLQAPDVAPTFDVVRVDAFGAALVAGLAPPKFAVGLEIDGAEIARTRSDAAGSFALFFDIPLKDVAQELVLVAYSDDGRSLRSDQSAIVAPRERVAEPPSDLVAGLPGDARPPAGDEEQSERALREVAPMTPQIATRTAGETTVPPTVESARMAAAQGNTLAMIDAAIDVQQGAAVEPQLPAVAGVAAHLSVQPDSAVLAANGTEPATQVLSAGYESAQGAAQGAAQELAQAKVGTTSVRGAFAGAVAPAAEVIGTMSAPPVEASAPAVFLTGASGVRVLQPSGSAGGQDDGVDAVVIDVIGYGPLGEVTLEGRGASGRAPLAGVSNVRVYLDNARVSDGVIAGDGRFVVDLPAIEAGVYTLRVDQIGPDGTVASRFETPFKREDPSTLAQLAPRLSAPGGVAASVITVQPGYTLWGIASGRYGDGLSYLKVFAANRTQIRNPDLIYPGQVFALPN
ncbi:MAG: nucleoid-associated protein YgaU [Paracoccaceae bacterium]|jgi:nucleoid-associated protein YgaU